MNWIMLKGERDVLSRLTTLENKVLEKNGSESVQFLRNPIVNWNREVEKILSISSGFYPLFNFV